MSLKDRLDEDDAEAWKPDTGDELIGKVIELSSRTTDYGTYQILTIKPEDGPAKAFHAFHTVAAERLNDLHVGLNDEVAIRYLGKVESESSMYGGYQGYKIVVEHPDGWRPPSPESEEARIRREEGEAIDAQAEQAEKDAKDESIPF